MARISIVHLGKDVPPLSAKGPNKNVPHRILGDVSLEIGDGEFLVLVGPSGCGKTTLLRCIAGLETITRGDLLLGGVRVNDKEPRERDIAMVFQSYALYPHLTVRDNLAFGLQMRKTPAPEIKTRVEEAAKMLEIDAHLDKYPRQLSGGQRQRVAMGRAVVRRPQVFLFDEPLSNLDAGLRGQMRVELKRLHARLGATMVYVTHDQVEAMTLANRIAVLRAGGIEQVGSPRDLYDRPANLFVARFLGTPEMNTITGTIDNGKFTAPGVNVLLEAPREERAVGGGSLGSAADVTLGVRSEDIDVVADGDTAAHATANVDVVENLGWESLVHVRVGDKALVTRVETAKAPASGAKVGLRFDPTRLHLFDKEGRRLAS